MMLKLNFSYSKRECFLLVVCCLPVYYKSGALSNILKKGNKRSVQNAQTAQSIKLLFKRSVQVIGERTKKS